MPSVGCMNGCFGALGCQSKRSRPASGPQLDDRRSRRPLDQLHRLRDERFTDRAGDEHPRAQVRVRPRKRQRMRARPRSGKPARYPLSVRDPILRCAPCASSQTSGRSTHAKQRRTVPLEPGSLETSEDARLRGQIRDLRRLPARPTRNSRSRRQVARPDPGRQAWVAMKTVSETSSGSSHVPDVLVAPSHRRRSRTPRERDGNGAAGEARARRS